MDVQGEDSKIDDEMDIKVEDMEISDDEWKTAKAHVEMLKKYRITQHEQMATTT